jgi:PST family polysaccharide transporter
MLLYNTHGWIHLSIGRPERWFRWCLLEFACTASLFLLTLRWGPSGIAFAWTASYFVLMFPGFWYAGKPIGLGMGPLLATIWKFFAASVGAGVGTFLLFKSMPYFAAIPGVKGAFVRMVSLSLVFLVLYLAAVIALHRGLRPLSEMADLIHDFLPERMSGRVTPGAVDANAAVDGLPEEAKRQSDLAPVLNTTAAKA